MKNLSNMGLFCLVILYIYDKIFVAELYMCACNLINYTRY